MHHPFSLESLSFPLRRDKRNDEDDSRLNGWCDWLCLFYAPPAPFLFLISFLDHLGKKGKEIWAGRKRGVSLQEETRVPYDWLCLVIAIPGKDNAH